MRLAYSFDINHDARLLGLCKASKDLYNQALYEVKRRLETDNEFLFYKDLNKIMQTRLNLENEVNYRKLKAQCSQQILMLLDKNIKSYIKSVKDYSKNKSKYKGVPKMPGYKKKYNNLIYTNQCCQIKDGYLILEKNVKIRIPQYDKYGKYLSSFNQVRVIAKPTYFKIEIVYSRDAENADLNYEEYSSIDLGIDNIVTLGAHNNQPILISGRQVKSINQYFNKRLAKYQSIKDSQNIKRQTKRICKLYSDRENAMNDVFHKISRLIVNYLVHNKIGNLVIGYNANWKDSVSLGNKTNQKFVQIPYLKLIDYLKYKCELVGIKLVLHEESYTSKCDALALEPVCKRESYSGKRVKRGLFQSSVGRLVNADVNGMLNILRKVVGDSYVSKIIDSGLLFNPVKVRNIFNASSKTFIKNLSIT
jgi:putative transposase